MTRVNFLARRWRLPEASRRVRFLALAVFLIALMPRLWLGLAYREDEILAKPGVDGEGYARLATYLLSGVGFSLDERPPYRPDTVRTPLYPLMVAGVYAVTGPSPRAVVLVQAALDALAAVLVLFIGRRLASPGAGLAAGLVYALAPTQWRFAATLMTEAPLAFLLTAALAAFVFIRRPSRQALALGLLSGLAILCKPNVLLLPVLWAGVLWWRVRPRWRASGLVLATAGLVLLPWAARNTAVLGRPTVSTAFQANLIHVSAVATLARFEGQTVAPWTAPWERYYTNILATAERRYGFDFDDAPTWSPAESDRHWRDVEAVAWEVIRAHPAEAAAAHLAGAPQVWWGPLWTDQAAWWPYEYQGWYRYLTGRSWPGFVEPLQAVSRSAGENLARGDFGRAAGLVAGAGGQVDPLAGLFWLAGHAFLWLGLASLAAGGWALRRQPAALAALLLIIGYLTLLPGPIGYERFRVPFTPLIAVLQGGGVVWLAAQARHRPLRFRLPRSYAWSVVRLRGLARLRRGAALFRRA